MSAGGDVAHAPAPARGRARAWIEAAVLGALAVAVYHRTAAALWTTWATNDNYSHGPLVPLTSFALVWLRWDKLRALAVRPDARGLGLVALASAMQVAGVRSDTFALQGWSLLPLLFGLSLTFFGMAVTRMLAFPLGYLGFMLTFPPVVMNQLSFALKEVAMRLAIWGAERFGAHPHRVGMILILPAGELRIENPCSGLRSLLALLATGTLFAYIQEGGLLRRALMLLTALPIAVLGNAVRLTALVVGADRRGIAWAAGRFHTVTGYVLYAVALGLLLGLRAWLTPRVGGSGGAAR